MASAEALTELRMGGIFVREAPVLQKGEEFYTSADLFAGGAFREDLVADLLYAVTDRLEVDAQADRRVGLRETADVVLWEAWQAHQRLVDGLEFVASDATALQCFQFVSRVMRDQRLASQIAEARKISQ